MKFFHYIILIFSLLTSCQNSITPVDKNISSKENDSLKATGWKKKWNFSQGYGVEVVIGKIMGDSVYLFITKDIASGRIDTCRYMPDGAKVGDSIQWSPPPGPPPLPSK